MSESFKPRGRLVDAGGFKLHLHCTGAGSPHVILDAGLGDPYLVWEEIQSQLEKNTRVCSYDRAGTGWSEAGPRPRTFQRSAEELHTALKNADETGPYVLVGHSAGANSARLFAARYPDETAGLVLIDPPILEQVPPALLSGLRIARKMLAIFSKSGGIEWLASSGRLSVLFGGIQPPRALAMQAGFLYRPEVIYTSIDEIDALPETVSRLNASSYPGAWRDWPVRIIAAQRKRQVAQSHAAALEKLATFSSRGRVVWIRGSHFVHFENPDTVTAAVGDVIKSYMERSQALQGI